MSILAINFVSLPDAGVVVLESACAESTLDRSLHTEALYRLSSTGLVQLSRTPRTEFHLPTALRHTQGEPPPHGSPSFDPASSTTPSRYSFTLPVMLPHWSVFRRRSWGCEGEHGQRSVPSPSRSVFTFPGPHTLPFEHTRTASGAYTIIHSRHGIPDGQS